MHEEKLWQGRGVDDYPGLESDWFSLSFQRRGSEISQTVMFISKFHRIVWVAKDPQASSSPALKSNPCPWCCQHQALTRVAEVRDGAVNSSDKRALFSINYSYRARTKKGKNSEDFQGVLDCGWNVWVWVCLVLHQPLCCRGLVMPAGNVGSLHTLGWC